MKYKGIELKVYDVVNRGADSFPAICQYSTWKHCAEIPELELVTYRELSRWIEEGNGEVKYSNTVLTNWNYSINDENKFVSENFSVRKWHKPTREYIGLESQQ